MRMSDKEILDRISAAECLISELRQEFIKRCMPEDFQFTAEEDLLITEGDRVHAIKSVRSRTEHGGLFMAKELVERRAKQLKG